MLILDNTSRLAGVTLWGDGFSLRHTHSVIHQIASDQNPALAQVEGDFALSLAYDMRKAYRAKRLRKVLDDFNGQPAMFYGVEIAWVMLVAQVAIIRAAAAYQTTTLRQQAVLFELEALIEEGAQDAFGADARHVMAMLRTLGADREGLVERVNARAIYHLGLETIEARRDAFLPVLWSLSPTYDLQYETLLRREGAEKRLIDPSVFRAIDPDAWPKSIAW